MKFEKIYHAPAFPDSYIELYVHDPHQELQINKRKTIVVCPGGGYVNLSEREGEPVALKYFAAGLNVAVLRYSTKGKAVNCAPLIESCLAIKYLRDHADELYVDEKYVYITGFSAGGHLAAWTGTMWHALEVAAHLDGADQSICKPTATLPCYPVITGDLNHAHRGSVITLNGGVEDEHLEYFSLEKHVDERTAPAFLWHTAEDTCVPVMNSLLYASALSANKIPFELHVFPKGPHGLSLCNKETWVNHPAYDNPYVACWMEMAIRFVTECPFEK